MIEDLLDRFDPDADVLLRAISSHVNDEMLDCVSRADYGEDSDEHLSALQQIRDTGSMPENLGWIPMEVLELIRWSEPEDPKWKPGRTGEFGHWMRAFSCAAILRAEHQPGSYYYNDGSTDSTTIQLILSLEAIPVDLYREAARHFAWLLLKVGPEGKNNSVREFAVALFWFALHLTPHVSDSDLIALAQWTINRADKLNWNLSLKEFPGLKAMAIGCQKRSAWELFGVKVSEFNSNDRSSDLQAWVKLLAEQLVD